MLMQSFRASKTKHLPGFHYSYNNAGHRGYWERLWQELVRLEKGALEA